MWLPHKSIAKLTLFLLLVFSSCVLFLLSPTPAEVAAVLFRFSPFRVEDISERGAEVLYCDDMAVLCEPNVNLYYIPKNVTRLYLFKIKMF
jgi:hypothetical protein